MVNDFPRLVLVNGTISLSLDTLSIFQRIKLQRLGRNMKELCVGVIGVVYLTRGVTIQRCNTEGKGSSIIPIDLPEKLGRSTEA